KVINIFKNVRIQIEPGYKATPFEPYNAQSFTITGDFKGMKHLDNCNYYDLAKGVKVQKVDEIVFDGESEFDGVQGVWSAAGPGDGTYTIVQWQSDPEHKISKLLSADDNVAPMCTHFVNQDGSLEWDYVEMYAGQYPSVYFYIAGNWTVDAFKQRLKELYDAGTPMKLRYALAEPIETPLTEAEIALLKGLKTFGEGTLVYNNDGALLEVEYQADTKKYIDNKIAELTAALITE
ncbi:MAG: hypothetical protein IJN43_07700, partial [Ruminococcus sp.]|nr:hypothetical protein [Ruminococcus sp.]